MPWLARTTFALARFAARLYYRQERLGEAVPTAGPVLLVANHPNGLVDAVLVAGTTEREVRFLGKAPLFDMPVLGSILRAMGTLPVYRVSDGHDTAQNEETFRAVGGALARGDAVALFPEGTTHGEPRLAKLKTGAARMALAAEAARGFTLGLRVVPVGLSFRHKRRFRSRAASWVALPIEVRALAEAYHVDARGAVLALTESIAGALRQVTLELESWEDLPLLELAARIQGPRTTHVADVKRLAQGLKRLRSHDPQALAKLADDLADFGQRLRRLGATPEDLDITYTLMSTLSFALGNLAALCFGLPVALLGFALWWPPYRLAPLLARAARPVEETFATTVLIASFVLFPLWWLCLGLAALALWGPLLALLALLLTPPLGPVSLAFFERRRAALGDLFVFLRLGLRREVKSELVRQRAALRERINALEAEFASAPAGPDPFG
jgi:1-acyl-sn-glycerol-3-phosphate acyltransferase